MPFISVDDHVQEPPDLWTRRLPKQRWGSRIPHVEGAQWVIDSHPAGSIARAGALMADRTSTPGAWEAVPAAAYVPAERLNILDQAGVEFSVLYPSAAGMAGQAFGSVADPELELACVQAYNDWLIEEWADVSSRFIPQCIVPISNPELTVAEIERAFGMGHRGVVFPAVPHELRDVPHVADGAWDVVWSVCEQLNVPLCLHAGSSAALQNPGPAGLSHALAGALNAVTKPVSSVYVLNLMLFSRILLRHPKLKVVMAESSLSWAMCDLEWSDHQFEHDHLEREGYDLTPLEIFHRQVYLNAWFDEVAPFAGYLGAGNILWSSNLPFITSTWPNTEATLERCMKGLSPADRQKILWDNAAALYGIT